MERLFRQRMEYLESTPNEECFLCTDAASDDLPANFVLYRSELCLIVMNRFPYNTGHLLISPHRHVGALEDLTTEERTEVMDLAVKAIGALRAAMSPEGFNMGANLGAAAGAGVPGHLHLHVVPRWPGDTNFMPVVGGSKGAAGDARANLCPASPAVLGRFSRSTSWGLRLNRIRL